MESLQEPSMNTGEVTPRSACCEPAGIGPAALSPTAREYLENIWKRNENLRAAYGLSLAGTDNDSAGGSA